MKQSQLFKSEPSKYLTTGEKSKVVSSIFETFSNSKIAFKDVDKIFIENGLIPPTNAMKSTTISINIEPNIIGNCPSFKKGVKQNDLKKDNTRWEVKIRHNSGLTINQSAKVSGEHYIVTNYLDGFVVKEIWVLYDSEDRFFSKKKANLNMRSLIKNEAIKNIDVLYTA